MKVLWLENLLHYLQQRHNKAHCIFCNTCEGKEDLPDALNQDMGNKIAQIVESSDNYHCKIRYQHFH